MLDALDYPWGAAISVAVVHCPDVFRGDAGVAKALVAAVEAGFAPALLLAAERPLG